MKNSVEFESQVGLKDPKINNALDDSKTPGFSIARHLPDRGGCPVNLLHFLPS